MRARFGLIFMTKRDHFKKVAKSLKIFRLKQPNNFKGSLSAWPVSTRVAFGFRRATM